jgi:pimeloyl-ACP methyl ester carboxylesterase
MTYVILILSWLFSLIFGLLTLSMILMRNWLQAMALLGVVLVLLPPVRNGVCRLSGRSVPWWGWTIPIAVLLMAFVWFSSFNKFTSAIYTSPEVKAKLLAMYEAKMKEWPVPYENAVVETEYGQVHVIISGPQDAPPLLLFHASGVGGWSWLYNVEDLSQHYRIYAFDTLGDAGRSELYNRNYYPRDGQALAELYREVAEKLGVERAYVVGASEGGFIGTNYALYAPERVEKLVLLGPMGYAGTNSSVLRIVLAQFFPLKPIQERTFRWAFSDDRKLEEMFGEWFRLLMSGTFPQKARPVQFTAEQRQSLELPVLLVLGEKDNLVGNPEKAKVRVQDMPNVRIEVLDTGHLIAAEQPERINALIIEFFE